MCCLFRVNRQFINNDKQRWTSLLARIVLQSKIEVTPDGYVSIILFKAETRPQRIAV